MFAIFFHDLSSQNISGFLGTNGDFSMVGFEKARTFATKAEATAEVDRFRSLGSRHFVASRTWNTIVVSC